MKFGLCLTAIFFLLDIYFYHIHIWIYVQLYSIIWVGFMPALIFNTNMNIFLCYMVWLSLLANISWFTKIDDGENNLIIRPEVMRIFSIIIYNVISMINIFINSYDN